MNYTTKYALVTLLALVLVGCAGWQPSATRMELTEVQNRDALSPINTDVTVSPAPPGPIQLVSAETDEIPISAAEIPISAAVREPWPLTLDQTVQLALANSPILRDLGARLIQAPALTPTIYEPAIQVTDPRFGVEAALSEFDAQFATRAFFDKNDRVLNNEVLGGGVNLFRQDLWRIQAELSKKAATGTELALRHNIEDDLNNATRNLFPRAYDWNLEAEVRHPLLQGGGSVFNRISGRAESPGVTTGVVIAQVNSKISTQEFQVGLRDFISNVENAYWDLYFAYRELDITKRARDRSQETIELIRQRREVDRNNVEDKFQQALEQYFRFQEGVENSLNGRLVDGTRTFNGSGGGTFQGNAGVFVAERRLRLLMGLPMQDGRVVQPITEPSLAPFRFNEDEAIGAAIQQRSELTMQRLRIERADLQLVAHENYLLPQLDVVGRYRFRGLGNNLYDPVVPVADFGGVSNVTSNRHEWQVGMELSYPIGFRQGHSAVRNSELRVARQRAMLAAMERQVSFDVRTAITDVERAFRVIELTKLRREAARSRYDWLSGKEQQALGPPDFNLLIDAQGRLAEAESAYYRARVAYVLALKNLHFSMGSLLSYANVHLAAED